MKIFMSIDSRETRYDKVRIGLQAVESRACDVQYSIARRFRNGAVLQIPSRPRTFVKVCYHNWLSILPNTCSYESNPVSTKLYLKRHSTFPSFLLSLRAHNCHSCEIEAQPVVRPHLAQWSSDITMTLGHFSYQMVRWPHSSNIIIMWLAWWFCHFAGHRKSAFNQFVTHSTSQNLQTHTDQNTYCLAMLDISLLNVGQTFVTQTTATKMINIVCHHRSVYGYRPYHGNTMFIIDITVYVNSQIDQNSA